MPFTYPLGLRTEARAYPVGLNTDIPMKAGLPSPTSVQAQGVKGTRTLFVGGKGRANKFHLHLFWKLVPIGNVEIQNKMRRHSGKVRRTTLAFKKGIIASWLQRSVQEHQGRKYQRCSCGEGLTRHMKQE